jgi:hypothetical protein
MSVAAEAVLPKRRLRTRPFSDQQIRELAEGRPHDIAAWVEATARERGVAVRPTPYDAFAKAVSRLSDGVVDLDPVEELLVALGRAGVITSFQRGLLQVHYLRSR